MATQQWDSWGPGSALEGAQNYIRQIQEHIAFKEITMPIEEPLRVCGKHGLPMWHRESTCPWCKFIADARQEMTNAYKRGFTDGMKAMEVEHEKKRREEESRRSADQRRQAAEVANADNSVPAAEQPGSDQRPSGDVTGQGSGGDEELRSEEHHKEE